MGSTSLHQLRNMYEDKIRQALNNRTVLITGGTGTFGRACVCYLRTMCDNVTIRIFSRDEYKQSVLQADWGSVGISYMLGDVRDIDRLRLALQGCDYVFHAAALKHVSLGEYNPREFIDTNILGTENVCRAAIDCGVEQVITLASDKGVNPINLYGATKLVAEKSTIQYNSYSPEGTIFKTVRYGNVAGSRGSVIGIFQRLLDAGKPITITDSAMTRFWMLIEEAVDLVMFAVTSSVRGGTFVPHLAAFDVMDLIEAMTGTTTRGIEEIGIRPGEKLHELLMTDFETMRAYRDPYTGTYVLPPIIHDWNPESSMKDLLPCTWAELYTYSSEEWPTRMGPEMLREAIANLIPE